MRRLDRNSIAPIVALGVFVLFWLLDLSGSLTVYPLGAVLGLALLAVLFATIFAAVHHAEVVAHRLGEPFGTLVLTLAVTIIEVALITSLMLGKSDNPALARDTVFSVIMIVCNGLVGACLLIGGLKYREQGFLITGANSYLMVLIAMGTLTLILPNYTLTTPGPVYTREQLAFVSLATVLLYATFLYVQTVRHQDYFVAEASGGQAGHDERAGDLVRSLGWLLVALVAVVLLAKKSALVVETALSALNAPATLAGLVVAMLILAPESLAAIKAARRDQLQRSVNLALGSSIATIGLTVPAVAMVDLVLQKQLVLGLSERDTVLLALTYLLSVVTFGTGRTNILPGLVHLVVFATFVFLLFVP